jgi:hypothetical protein
VAVPVPHPVPQPAAPAYAAPQAANPFADFDAPTDASTAPPKRQHGDEDQDEDAPRRKKKRDRDRDDRDDRDERDDRDRDRDRDRGHDRDRDDRDDREERKEKPARPSYSRDSAKSSGGGLTMVLLLAIGAYAMLATVAAVYGLFIKGDKVDTGHPLSTIPDNFGEFDPAVRKKVTQLKFNEAAELPTAQRGALGETISVGQLEIKPIDIIKRQLVIETEGKSETRKDYPGTALVLRLDIKNNSDISLYPMDPAFTRKSSSGDLPLTRIVVNKNTIYAGGAIQWPNSALIKKRMESQQKNDFIPLAPGESREYIVFSDAKAEIIRAVERSNDAMQWRVQVRRDPITYRGKEVPVTALIGVDFSARDVRE